MEVFTMVVLIVAISCGAGVINNYLKNQRMMLKGAPSEELLGELDALKQRVAALEEIVTDERYDLRRELDRLERQA
jgi:phage shock protein C